MARIHALFRPLAGLAATAALAALSLASTHAAAASVSVDDTARVIAGLKPSAGSPLEAITKDGAWQGHANSFDKAWKQLDDVRLSKIRAWYAANMTDTSDVLYYMFSGPDFLYADAFFPDRSVYVLSALEPVGKVPDLLELPRGALHNDLAELRSSMGTSLNLSFFITQRMASELRSGRLTGTLPVLYVFLVRAGKTITDMSYVSVDKDGKLVAGDAPEGKLAPGVKISFKSATGKEQTLYYFSTNVSDEGLTNSGFLKFMGSLGTGGGFIKSASCLPHKSHFSQIRDFLLANTSVLLQDDCGIPMRFFKPTAWKLHPFGRYTGPLGIFPGTNQPDLARLFRSSAKPIEFGVGYRYRPKESNLLMAVKGDYPEAAGAETAPAAAAPAAAPAKKGKTVQATQAPAQPYKPRKKKKQQSQWAPFF